MMLDGNVIRPDFDTANDFLRVLAVDSTDAVRRVDVGGAPVAELSARDDFNLAPVIMETDATSLLQSSSESLAVRLSKSRPPPPCGFFALRVRDGRLCFVRDGVSKCRVLFAFVDASDNRFSSAATDAEGVVAPALFCQGATRPSCSAQFNTAQWLTRQLAGKAASHDRTARAYQPLDGLLIEFGV